MTSKAWGLAQRDSYPSCKPLTLRALNHAAGHVQALLRDQVTLRHVPRLAFRLDPTIKKQAEVFQAIRRGMQSRPEPESPGPDEDQSK